MIFGKSNHQGYKAGLGGLCLLLLVVVCISGCSDDGLTAVSGTVTFDGEPVADGSISFMPVDGNGITAGGIIENGKYKARVSPGEMAIQIHASREVKKDNPTAEEIERGLDSDMVPYIPSQYNLESTLKETIDGTNNELNFDLVSEPAADPAAE